MVTPHWKLFFYAVEDIILRRVAARSLHAMENVSQIGQSAPEGFAYCLMPEAYSQYRFSTGIVTDYIQQQPGFLRYAGSGAENDFIVFRNLLQSETVVTQHWSLHTHFTHQMKQVEREGIIIINNDCFHKTCYFYTGTQIFSAINMAWRRAPNLLLTSCNSYSSLLFATIPPPAWNHSSLLRLTNVRMVMA